MSYDSDYSLSSEHRGALRKAKQQVNAGFFSFTVGAIFVGLAIHDRLINGGDIQYGPGGVGGTALLSGIGLLVKGLINESKVKKQIRVESESRAPKGDRD